MTPESVKQTVQTIVTDLEAVGTLAAGVDPALIPYISIGKAVADQLPGLAEAVTNWLEGNAPTDAEKQTLVNQLTTLGNPNSP